MNDTSQTTFARNMKRNTLLRVKNITKIRSENSKIAQNSEGCDFQQTVKFLNISCSCDYCSFVKNPNTKKALTIQEIGQRDLQNRERMKQLFPEAYNRGFKFVVEKLKNISNPSRGTIHLLIADTVFFEGGRVRLFITKGKAKNYGKYTILDNTEQPITASLIKRVLLDRNVPRKYLAQKPSLGKYTGVVLREVMGFEKLEKFTDQKIFIVGKIVDGRQSLIHRY